MCAQIQVQPTLQKIVNQLAVDCDRFFDEIAELNEALIDREYRDMT